MNIKRFLTVFCSLCIIIVMVIGVAAATYDQLEIEIDEDGNKVYKLGDKKPTGALNILLIGRDKGGMLTDTMMFVRVDNDNEEVNIISIPRDTYVNGTDVGVQKLNALYSIGGIEKTVECIEDILGVKIDFHVSITTEVFRDIIDAVDGVDFYVPQDMDYEDPYQDLYIHLKEGQQHLDGDKAEQLVRFRSYPQGDIQRTQVQRDFIQAIISQKKSLKYINRIDDIYRGVVGDLETNIKLKDVLENVVTFKNLDVKNKLNAYVLPNIPQYVGEASFVFIMEDKLEELLTEEFGIKKSETKERSGDYVYTMPGVSNQSTDYSNYEEYMATQNGEKTSTDKKHSADKSVQNKDTHDYSDASDDSDSFDEPDDSYDDDYGTGDFDETDNYYEPDDIESNDGGDYVDATHDVTTDDSVDTVTGGGNDNSITPGYNDNSEVPSVSDDMGYSDATVVESEL